MTGNLLVLIGIFIILLGFLIIIIGTAIGMREGSKPERGYSKRKDGFRKEADSIDSFHFEGPEKKETYEGEAESKIRGGGVIMLGPIPIIFGSDRESANTAAILAIVLMILSLLVFKGLLF